MKNLAKAVVLSLIFFGAPAMAGSGHDHGYTPPVNQQTAEINADKVIDSLVTRDKVDKSWAAIKASSVEKKVLNGRPEWVVIFTNDKITDAEKQNLYVFLTLGGNYIAVNYTGK